MLCGFITLIAIYIIFLILFRDAHSGINAAMPLGIGMVFVAVVGWFPVWTILFVIIIIAFVLLDPLGSSGG